MSKSQEPPREMGPEYMGPLERHADGEPEGRVVGQGKPSSGGRGKVDGIGKIVGSARFTADLSLPRMAHVKVLRSPHPHAKILSIDTTAAESMPGVLAIATGQDLPIRYGAIPVAQDETALAMERVRYVGEPVVAVCATTESMAWDACRKVRVVYEPIEPVFTFQDALDPEKPLIHPPPPGKKRRRNRGNILRRVYQDFGDVEAGFAEADLVIEEEYSYPGSTHVPLEPHAALAVPDPGGRLTLWSSTQNLHYLHRSLAKVLSMRETDLRVIKPEVGAGYGGKCDPFVTDICAAHFARKLGRPVRFVLDREEVFYAHRGRHPTQMRLKMGMTADGRITAIDFVANANGGAYASYGVVTAYYLGVFGTLPYQIENYRFTTMRAYTNLPPCGPKRGHGAIQPRFALEMHLDRMADELGLDPDQIRLSNMVAPNTETINGLRVTSVGLGSCLEQVIDTSGYRNRKGKLPKGRGIGMAASAYMSGALHGVYQNEMPQSGVQIKLDRSGRVTIFSGTADVGQGSNHMLAVVVAERLGIAPEDCTVIEADTDLTPVDLGSYSSRVTFMAGNAALQAVDRLREQIVSVVAEKLECEPSDLVARNHRIFRANDPTKGMDWAKAVQLAESTFGTLGSTGSYRPPKIGSRFRRSSVGPSPAYSFTAQVAEVTVDQETGEVSVDQIWCAHDLGRTLHTAIAEGQVEGCVYMGVGEALMEEQRYANGVHRGPSILEYKVPTIYDTPNIHTILVESHDPEGPFGAKEVGEGPQLSTVPAIANAIHDAIGIWMPHPPFTPDKVLKALKKKAREEGAS